MKKILFQNTQNSYLPEIQAYKEYFESKGMKIFLENSDEPTDINWKIMGLDFKKNPELNIHDYPSLSSGGLFPQIKDLAKKLFNTKPDLRLFLNEDVRKRLNFKDNTPYLIRDMGIHKSFFNSSNIVKEYDFVYLGTLSKERGLNKLIDIFSSDLKRLKLLLIGSIPEELNLRIKNLNNITCTGKLTLNEVPYFAAKAIYGINFIPDVYPYNIQTSTKLLEYCALDLKIITTEYFWVNNFERKNNARFYKLKRDFSNFNTTDLENFEFITPNLEHLEWNKLLDKIDLFNTINRLKV